MNSSKVVRRSLLQFEIIDTRPLGDQVIVGSVQFDLNKIDKQEDYDVTLEILEEEDDSNSPINSKINAKISFIWSFFEYYMDQLKRTEKNVKSYKALLDKSNSLLENLNGKFLFYWIRTFQIFNFRGYEPCRRNGSNLNKPN